MARAKSLGRWVLFLGLSLPSLGACGSSSDSTNEGTAGTGAQSGTSGTSGASGNSGSAGTAGSSGASGASGSSGSSGAAGSMSSGPITCRVTGDGRTTFAFVNRCSKPLTIQGSGIEDANINPGDHACRDIGNTSDEISSIRYWGFVQNDDPGAGRYTLAELTLNTDFNDYDWYDISHVDADNLPMAIVPVERADCRTLSCPTNVLPMCPAEGVYKNAQGEVTACVSPNRDDPTNPVAQLFESTCADAYSWSGDDAESMAACAAEDFDIVFCP